MYCLNVGIIAPAWSMTERDMVFALSPQNVKAFLSRGNRHEPLSKMPRVAELLAGDNAPSMVAYCDSPKLWELFYPMLSFYGPMISNGVRAAGVDVDLSLLPSGAAINRHMRPRLITLRRTKHGVELANRGTLPYPGPAVWVGLIVLATSRQHDGRDRVQLRPDSAAGRAGLRPGQAGADAEGGQRRREARAEGAREGGGGNVASDLRRTRGDGRAVGHSRREAQVRETDRAGPREASAGGPRIG